MEAKADESREEGEGGVLRLMLGARERCAHCSPRVHARLSPPCPLHLLPSCHLALGRYMCEGKKLPLCPVVRRQWLLHKHHIVIIHDNVIMIITQYIHDFNDSKRMHSFSHLTILLPGLLSSLSTNPMQAGHKEDVPIALRYYKQQSSWGAPFSHRVSSTVLSATNQVAYRRHSLPCYAIPIQRNGSTFFLFKGSLAACEGELPRFDQDFLDAYARSQGQTSPQRMSPQAPSHG